MNSVIVAMNVLLEDLKDHGKINLWGCWESTPIGWHIIIMISGWSHPEALLVEVKWVTYKFNKEINKYKKERKILMCFHNIFTLFSCFRHHWTPCKIHGFSRDFSSKYILNGGLICFKIIWPQIFSLTEVTSDLWDCLQIVGNNK